MPLFSRSDSGASLFSISHLRQKIGQGDARPKAKSLRPKARVKGDGLPSLTEHKCKPKIANLHSTISSVDYSLILLPLYPIALCQLLLHKYIFFNISSY